MSHAVAGTVAVLLLAAVLRDIATRTVPNWLPAMIAALGFGLRLADGNAIAGTAATATVLLGAGLCWSRGWMGGGDAKLAAAASLALPPAAIGPFLLAVALVGGVLALIYLAASHLVTRPAPGIRRGFLARILKAEAWRMHRRGPLPYAAAIAAGGLYSLLPFIAG